MLELMDLPMQIEILKKEIKEKQNELARLEALNQSVEFTVGKTYMTEWSAPEPFTITSIRTNKKGEVIGFFGIYENSHKHLGICPLGYRLNHRSGVYLS